MSLIQLLSDVRACTACELPHGHNPVLQMHPSANVLIVGQAPGSKVHETGIAFDDPSGKRLREWMGVNESTFYDEHSVAILPMAFCYPGKGRSGDLPPPARCAALWRNQLLEHLKNIRLTLIIGQYAMRWHLPENTMNVTDAVQAWQTYPDSIMVLPHPSPRNNIWLKKNPWFELEVLPALKARVRLALK